MMKKVYFVCASLQGGGAERVLSILSEKLPNCFDEVQYIMWYDAPIFYSINQNVKLVSIEKESGSKSTFEKMRWFRNYIKHTRPSIVLSFSAPFNMLTLASLLFMRTKVIACERVDPSSFRWGKTKERIRNLLYCFASGILVQTQTSKNYFKGGLLKITSVIYNPMIMPDHYLGAAINTTKEKLIVTAARLEPQKRQDILIRVFARFLESHPGYQLVIYGRGQEEDKLKDLASSLCISESVKFAGSVKDLWDRILPAKMFVMTSAFEGMSNSMIEAMALGIPVISTRVSGAVDLIEDGVNGILVDINDEEKLLSSMCQIADDNTYANNIGAKGMQVYKLLNADEISKQWIDYIKRKIDE